MDERNRKIKILIISGLVGGILFLHYSSWYRADNAHLSFGLFFLPVLLSGYWFGLQGGVIVSLSVTLSLILPSLAGFRAEPWNNIIHFILYVTVAVVLGTVRDREKECEKRLREGERLAADKAIFGLVHDLKSSLIAIVGFTRLARKYCSGENGALKRLDLVIEEASRLEKVAGEILEFSRPMTLTPKWVDVGLVINRALEIASNKARQKGVILAFQSPPELPSACIDSNWVERGLTDILIDLIEGSPEAIHIAFRKRKSSLVIEINLGGKETRLYKNEGIFLPSFSRSQEGPSIKFATAEKIIGSLGGTLSVHNLPGFTKFQIRLPLRTQGKKAWGWILFSQKRSECKA